MEIRPEAVGLHHAPCIDRLLSAVLKVASTPDHRIMIVISGTGIVVALVGVVRDCKSATTPSAAADAIFLASIHVFFTIEFLPALSI